MDISKKLGEEIRGLRNDKLKLTQKELAEVVDVSIVYLSYLEQGKKSPSLKLLNKIYRLAGYKRLPIEIIEILKEVKKEKKAKSFNNAPTNIIYRLEEVGVYSYNQLTKLIKKDPANLDLIYGMLSLLIESGDLAEAKKYLLQSLLHIENLEEKKWLEASYYDLEANYPFAIQLLQEAMAEFSEKNTKQSKQQQKKNISRLLFQLATIYFKYGQKLFYEDQQVEAIKYFHLSLEKHEELKKISTDPFYQMDYAGIFFWLALLGINPEEYWPKYIKEVKLALALNFEQSLVNFPIKSWKSLYSRAYIISAVSFLIRAYAEYSKIIKTIEDKKNLLKEGEFLLAQYTPVEINPRENIFYRYYFNQACYHSLKAEVFASLDEDFETELVYCGNVLKMISKNIQLHDREKFQQELKNSKGIAFFRSNFASSILVFACQEQTVNFDKKIINPVNDLFSAKEGPDSTGSISKNKLTEEIIDNTQRPNILREGPDSTGSKALLKLFLKISEREQNQKTLAKDDFESIEVIYQTETFKIKTDEIANGGSLINDQLVYLVLDPKEGLNLFSTKKDLPEKVKINVKGKSIPILIPITNDVCYKTLLASVNFSADDCLELYLDINDEEKEINNKKLFSEFIMRT